MGRFIGSMNHAGEATVLGRPLSQTAANTAANSFYGDRIRQLACRVAPPFPAAVDALIELLDAIEGDADLEADGIDEDDFRDAGAW